MATVDPRELTAIEREAVNRLEKALAAVPESLAIYFESEGSFFVFDREVWAKGPGNENEWGQWVQDSASDDRPIDCRFDVGAL